jgi:hypothetical protein
MRFELCLVGLLVVAGCTSSPAGAAESPVAGDWVYSFAELIEGEKTYKTSVSGELKLTADGKFQQSRRIGGVLNPGKGTYTVQKDRLVLKYADGSKPDTYTFQIGSHTDSQGTKFKALTLTSKSSDGSGFKYLLTKKE